MAGEKTLKLLPRGCVSPSISCKFNRNSATYGCSPTSKATSNYYLPHSRVCGTFGSSFLISSYQLSLSAGKQYAEILECTLNSVSWYIPHRNVDFYLCRVFAWLLPSVFLKQGSMTKVNNKSYLQGFVLLTFFPHEKGTYRCLIMWPICRFIVTVKSKSQ